MMVTRDITRNAMVRTTDIDRFERYPTKKRNLDFLEVNANRFSCTQSLPGITTDRHASPYLLYSSTLINSYRQKYGSPHDWLMKRRARGWESGLKLLLADQWVRVGVSMRSMGGHSCLGSSSLLESPAMRRGTSNRLGKLGGDGKDVVRLQDWIRLDVI